MACLTPSMAAPPLPRLHSSPIGIIPKNQPGEWRLITDIFSPKGASVNDGILHEWCSLSYPTVHEAASIACSIGKGTLLAKMDLKSAYRTIPVHPDDRRLLCVKWNGETFIDGAHPFGLRSAPKIFTAVADTLMESSGAIPYVIHYLDDFLFFGPPNSLTCAASLEKAIELCNRLGVPLAPNKIEGPASILTFLGINIDTNEFRLSLPLPKLIATRTECRQWHSHCSCTKCQLQSLVGQLNHAAAVIGRCGGSLTSYYMQALPITTSA